MFKFFCSKLSSYTLPLTPPPPPSDKPKKRLIFFKSVAVLQFLQLDSRKRSVAIIISSLHFSCLITCNVESNQAVKS